MGDEGVGLVWGVCQLQVGPGCARAKQDQSQDEADADRGGADEEGEVVAPDQGADVPLVGGDQTLGVVRGDGAEDGQPDRAADLLGDVGDPRAEPGVAAGTSAIAIVSSGMNAVPMPRPIAKQARKIVGKKAVCGPTVLNRSRPMTALAIPAISTRQRPKPIDEPRGDAPRQDATVIVQGRNAAPVWTPL